jgi:hypothetical protein
MIACGKSRPIEDVTIFRILHLGKPDSNTFIGAFRTLRGGRSDARLGVDPF